MTTWSTCKLMHIALQAVTPSTRGWALGFLSPLAGAQAGTKLVIKE